MSEHPGTAKYPQQLKIANAVKNIKAFLIKDQEITSVYRRVTNFKFFCLNKITLELNLIDTKQTQASIGVLVKRRSENIHQIDRGMPKRDFNKVTKQLY